MGCAQSRLDNEESVLRCKERRNFMKEAVVARNAFAAGHTGYAMALKNTGAALSDYGHSEVKEAHHENHLQTPVDALSQPQPPPPPPPQFDNSPPPPPPPNFSPSPVQRSTSMPEIMLNQHRRPYDKVAFTIEEEEKDEEHEQEAKHGTKNAESTTNNIDKNLGGSRVPHGGDGYGGPQAASSTPETPPMPEAKNMSWDYFFMDMPGSSFEPEPEPELEQDEVTNENHTESNVESMGYGEVDPKTPEKPVEEKVEAEVTEEEERKQIEHSKTAPGGFRRVLAEGVVSSVNLMQVLSDIDDQFLKASECAQEVSKMLEATRLHYHSNFADNRGSPLLACFGSKISYA